MTGVASARRWRVLQPCHRSQTAGCKAHSSRRSPVVSKAALAQLGSQLPKEHWLGSLCRVLAHRTAPAPARKPMIAVAWARLCTAAVEGAGDQGMVWVQQACQDTVRAVCALGMQSMGSMIRQAPFNPGAHRLQELQ